MHGRIAMVGMITVASMIGCCGDGGGAHAAMGHKDKLVYAYIDVHAGCE